MQGAAGTETSYGSPREAALAWQRDGAEWIHLVDLDAAFGKGNNRELLAAVVAELDVKVELSGGIRDDDSLAAAMATGCTRVNLGTAALENPDWCRKAIAEYGDRIAVGLDVINEGGSWRLRGRGWVTDGGDLWRCSNVSTTTAAPAAWSPTSPGRHPQGPQPGTAGRGRVEDVAPIVASGGVSAIGSGGDRRTRAAGC